MGARRWKNSSLQTAFTYNSWLHMLDRCYNPNADQYAYYGGRGITVCAEWRTDYDKFFVDMGERPQSMTLERIDNNGNYEPSNCRWASRVEQAQNRKSSRFIIFNGITRNLTQWAKALGIEESTLRQYANRNGDRQAVCRFFNRMDL